MSLKTKDILNILKILRKIKKKKSNKRKRNKKIKVINSTQPNVSHLQPYEVSRTPVSSNSNNIGLDNMRLVNQQLEKNLSNNYEEKIYDINRKFDKFQLETKNNVYKLFDAGNKFATEFGNKAIAPVVKPVVTPGVTPLKRKYTKKDKKNIPESLDIPNTVIDPLPTGQVQIPETLQPSLPFIHTPIIPEPKPLKTNLKKIQIPETLQTANIPEPDLTKILSRTSKTNLKKILDGFESISNRNITTDERTRINKILGDQIQLNGKIKKTDTIVDELKKYL